MILFSFRTSRARRLLKGIRNPPQKNDESKRAVIILYVLAFQLYTYACMFICMHVCIYVMHVCIHGQYTNYSIIIEVAYPWDDKRRHTLIFVMNELQQDASYDKGTGVIKKKGWKTAVNKFNKHEKGHPIQKPELLRAEWTRLKEQYKLYTLITTSSGFGNLTAPVSDEVWNSFMQDKKKKDVKMIKAFRAEDGSVNPWPFYEAMQYLLGQTLATYEDGKSPVDLIREQSNYPAGDDNPLHLSKSNMLVKNGQSANAGVKRKRQTKGEMQSEFVKTMQESLGSLIEVMKEPFQHKLQAPEPTAAATPKQQVLQFFKKYPTNATVTARMACQLKALNDALFVENVHSIIIYFMTPLY
jgi:hypothetical protein